jgi:CDP-diacylglycerol--serine O-phosphatidyltransferase
MDTTRLRYLLPNVLTLGNMFSGIYSITLSMTAETAHDAMLAAWFVLIAMLCDLMDGRMARLVDAKSEFGTQMDSLTDAISFGLAPGFLIYSWGMPSMELLGVFFAFLFASGAIMRLARFNVRSDRKDEGPSKYFMGLPTPLAAGMVVSIVLAHTSLTGRATVASTWSVAVLAVMLGGLMVSNLRYRTFKNVDWNGRAIGLVAVLALALGGLLVGVGPYVALVAGIGLYVVAGIGGGIVHWGRSTFGDDDAGDESFLVETPEEQQTE